MQRSPAFNAFLECLTQPPSPKELHCPLQVFRSLSEAERRQAVAILAERIREHSDIRAIYTVGLLGDPLAEAALRAAAQSGSPLVLGAAQVALARLLGESSDLEGLHQSLQSAEIGARTVAAAELARMQRLDASCLLLGVLSDPEMVIRVHALEGLLRQLGLDKLAEPRESPLSTLQVQLYTQLSTVYLPAAHRIRELFTQILQGISAPALGLNYEPQSDPAILKRFVKSMLQPQYDLELLAKLKGPERAWADALIVAALERQDPRAARALARLNARHAVPVLREALKNRVISDEFREATQEALSHLDIQGSIL